MTPDDQPATTKVDFELNGSHEAVDAPIGQPLLTTLRESLGVRSARGTCGVGVCGTCTVLVDGRAASACILMTQQVAGRSVVTSEGLVGDDGDLDPVQDAFVANNAFQCSFCIPAMVLTVKAHLADHPDADVEEVREVLGGNLCRCGSYPEILAAVADLVQPGQGVAPDAPGADDRQDAR